jgi:magnesium-dependent phosphatase 1
MNAFPELIVFDLDFTLWDCGGAWIDCATYPFTRHENGKVTDERGLDLKLYTDMPEILAHSKEQGARISIASRTHEPGWALDLLGLFGLVDYFEHPQIFPGEKRPHFHELHSITGITFENMLFFDDEPRNIEAVGSLGVCCVPVEKGVDWSTYHAGIEQFSSANRRG